MIDLIIRNGKIIDGTGNSSFLSDIAVNDGIIVEIEKSSNLEAKEEWNALGKVICPGFIDIHSHADFSLLADRRNESAIRQGITTVVTGNCGHGPAPAGNHKLVKQNTVGFSEIGEWILYGIHSLNIWSAFFRKGYQSMSLRLFRMEQLGLQF